MVLQASHIQDCSQIEPQRYAISPGVGQSLANACLFTILKMNPDASLLFRLKSALWPGVICCFLLRKPLRNFAVSLSGAAMAVC